MSNFVGKFFNRFDGHMQELLRGASVAFVLNILATGLSFGFTIILAQLLGAEGTGIFFLALTILVILTTISRLGMGTALVKFIAANVVAGQLGKVLGVYQKATLYALIASIFMSMILYILAPWMSRVIFSKPELMQPLSIIALAIIPLTLLTLHSDALKGLKRIAASITVLSILVPILSCLIAVIFVPSYGIDAAAWGYLLATIVALLVGWWWWKSVTRSWQTKKIQFDTQELLACSMPFLSAGTAYLIITWFPLLMLGVWESNESVGIYSVAYRVAMFTGFIFIAVNSITMPKFSELYQMGDIAALDAVARNATKMMVLFASPLLLLFLIFPEQILSIFGEEFKAGGVVLSILAIGQFINIATGSVCSLLNMCGHERLMRNNLIFCVLIGVPLSVILIKNYGIVGGAIATAIMLSMQNLIAAVLVKNKLGITMLPFFGKTRREI